MHFLGLGRKYEPHVTITYRDPKTNAQGVHDHVRSACAQYGKLTVKALGLQLWKHSNDGKKSLVESFEFYEPSSWAVM